MGTIVSEIYNQVMADLSSETDDGLNKIASTFYGLDTRELSREEIMDRIASVEVEVYLK